MMMNIFKSTLEVPLRWMSSNYEQKEFMHFEYKSLFRRDLQIFLRDSGFFFHICNTYAQSEIFLFCLLYLLESVFMVNNGPVLYSCNTFA